MTFTGKNLLRVRRCIDLALDELHNQIATCPNVFDYADDIADIEEDQAELKKLLAKIDKELSKPCTK